MAKIKFLSLDGLLEMQANNEKFRLIEVLKHERFIEGHIHGAISMPLDTISQNAKKLRKSEKIVVYCASYGCHASTNAAGILLKMGFKNTLDFKGGKQAWEAAGLELVK